MHFFDRAQRAETDGRKSLQLSIDEDIVNGSYSQIRCRRVLTKCFCFTRNSAFAICMPVLHDDNGRQDGFFRSFAHRFTRCPDSL